MLITHFLIAIITDKVSRILSFHCFRYSFGKSFSDVNEDCLYLNVYAPKVFYTEITSLYIQSQFFLPLSWFKNNYNCLFQSSIRMSTAVFYVRVTLKDQGCHTYEHIEMIMITDDKQIIKRHNAIQSDVWTFIGYFSSFVWFLETNRTQTWGCSKHSVQAWYCNGQLTNFPVLR